MSIRPIQVDDVNTVWMLTERNFLHSLPRLTLHRVLEDQLTADRIDANLVSSGGPKMKQHLQPAALRYKATNGCFTRWKRRPIGDRLTINGWNSKE